MKRLKKIRILKWYCPIGKLFDDQNGLLLNELNKEVDEGESGELCVSGSQVTEGYLNNIEKTKSQYIKFSHDL